MSGEQQTGPLAGVRVLEFCAFVAGPFACKLLADMGADVIKVEPPSGDPWRHHRSIAPAESRFFLALNRGKRSICIDLTNPTGREVCHGLVKSADLVVTNNRPEVCKKLGIDYPTLAGINPRLVYVEIGAYGHQGPDAERPAFDFVMQAYSGVMSAEGKVNNGHPLPVASCSYIDFASGYCAAASACAALFSRERSGHGQTVETSLLANALAMQSQTLVRVESALSQTQRWLKERLPQLKKGNTPYEGVLAEYLKVRGAFPYHYRAYRTKDWAICVGALGIRHRLRLLEALGLSDPELQGPPYDPTSQEARRAEETLHSSLEQAFLGKTTDEWISFLREKGIPCEPVRFVEEMFDNEQALANGYVVEVEHQRVGRYRTSGTAAHFSRDGVPPARASPSLGQHTDEVLAEVGYSTEQIMALRAKKTVS